MGAKSTSDATPTAKDMLPLFRVVSDLERTPEDVVIEEAAFTDLTSTFPDCVSSEDSRRNKKRRRLKGQKSTATASSSTSGSIIESYSNMATRNKKHQSKKDRFVLRPEIHSTLEKNEGQNLGMFTAMSLNKYRDEEVDLSRHFKYISNDDLILKDDDDDCPVYEVPNDLITGQNSQRRKKKKKAKRVKHEYKSTESINLPEIHKKRISKRAIIKSYEYMLEKLMKKCEDKDCLIVETEESLVKIRKKLRQALFFNNQFAEENEFLKQQHADMKNCIEQYKIAIESFERQQSQTDVKRELIVAADQTACPKCSIVELSALKIEKENLHLNEQMLTLKSVISSLNQQLSQHQEKMKMAKISYDAVKSIDRDTVEKEGKYFQDSGREESEDVESKVSKTPDLNLNALAPLMNAYQDSLIEKDNLIHDYEKEFNRLTIKLKEVIFENKNLQNSSSKMENQLIALREASGLNIKERDDLRKENYLLKNKYNESEERLKILQEEYEQKVESMSRDYNLIHQEYFKTKTGLALIHGKCQALEQKNSQMEVIPVRLHTAKIDECQKMLNELRTKYEIDKNKYTTKVTLLEDNNVTLEKRYMDASTDRHRYEQKLKGCERVIKKYKNIVMSYRKEVVVLKSSRDTFKRRAIRATNLCRQLTLTLDRSIGNDRIQHIKAETNNVHKEALRELNVLENRMKEQEKTLDTVKKANDVEVAKLEEKLREKDALIEAMRLRLRGESLTKYVKHSLPDVRQAHGKVYK